MEIKPNAYYNYLRNAKADYHKQKQEICKTIRDIYHDCSGGVTKMLDHYSFTFIFHRKNIDNINEKINDKIRDKIKHRVGKGDKIKIDIDATILGLISENATITIPEIARNVGSSEATVYRHMKNMMEKDIIVRNGSRKNGYWKII